MNPITPNYKGSDRWLERGKVIDSTKLNTVLGDIETGLNSFTNGGTLDHDFGDGKGIQYDRSENATGKYVTIGRADDDPNIISIDMEIVGGFPRSDTAFTIIALDRGCRAYGAKWLSLAVRLVWRDSAAAYKSPEIAHPYDLQALDAAGLLVAGFASYNAANMSLVIRESSNFASPLDGHHVFAIGGGSTVTTLKLLYQAPMASAGGGTWNIKSGAVGPGGLLNDKFECETECIVRNINNSFALRAGTKVMDESTGGVAAASALIIRVSEAFY